MSACKTGLAPAPAHAPATTLAPAYKGRQRGRMSQKFALYNSEENETKQKWEAKFSRKLQ